MDLVKRWLKNEDISSSHLHNARQSVVGAWIRWRFRWCFLWDFVHVGLETNVKFLTRALCFCCYNFYSSSPPPPYFFPCQWSRFVRFLGRLESGSNLTRMAYVCDKSRVIRSRRLSELEVLPNTFSKTALMTSNTRSRLHNRSCLDHDRVKSESPATIKQSFKKPAKSTGLVAWKNFCGLPKNWALERWRLVGSMKNIIRTWSLKKTSKLRSNPLSPITFGAYMNNDSKLKWRFSFFSNDYMLALPDYVDCWT